jgi:Protein of unknown function (DUF3567)
MQFSFIRKIPMDMLYNSDTYSVMHLHVQDDALVPVRPDVPALARHGFEIVDKRSGKEIYLEGSWAEQFQAHLRAWQENAPTQEEVEDTLAGYAELAQNPVVVH